MSNVRRSLFVLVVGLAIVLAACGPSVPSAVQTAAPAQSAVPSVPTVNATAAVQTAVPALTALPSFVPTNVPGAIQTAASSAGTIAANTLTVSLAADNNSGETGAAVLTEVGGKTTVVVTITGEPAGASQPMHIHEGSCGPTLGKVVFTLTPLQNGVSTTTVDTTISNLKSAKYAINGHKSASEMSVYVFCGNITQ